MMNSHSEKAFSHERLSGSNLLQKLTKPNGMVLTRSYETGRDLLTGLLYKRGATTVSRRT